MLDLSKYNLDYHERTTVTALLYAQKRGELNARNLRQLAERALFLSMSCAGTRGFVGSKDEHMKAILAAFRDLQKNKIVL